MTHEYIGLQRFCDLCGGVVSRGNGEVKLKCPAHDDKKASMTVKETEKGLLIKCHAGCETDAICKRLDIPMASLFREPPKGRSARSGRAQQQPKAPPPEEPPAKVFNSYFEAYGRLGKIERCYPYTDSNGVLRFEVARIRQADGDKTFRQHRPAKPDGSDQCAFPIRLDVPASLRDTIIYRQRETEEAVRAGKTIYVVEGEKDADTMARMGLTATTNAGGGGKNKWKDAHAEHLKGAAEVVIIPDNDSTGVEHAAEVLRSVGKVAKSAYVVNLRDGYKELKPKGDFTDLTEAVGDAQALEILHQLEEQARTSLWQRAMQAYSDIPGYGIDQRRTCQMVEGTPKMLCNFVALPIEIVETDNGVSIEKSLRIVGWNLYGKQLKTVLVPMSKFKSMDWVLESWDVEANIMPGNVVRDKLRWIMTEAAFKVAKRETVYAHCGWRKIGGRWAYLDQGKSIGAKNVNVDMGHDLAGYSLTGWPERTSPEEAALTSYQLSMALPAPISVPLLGITYLAPLCEFLDQILAPPSFVTALIGEHGTHKTTIASLFINHFGRFGIRGMPANFTGTMNALRNKAFAAKDTLLVVDDYFPTGSLQKRKEMENMMQLLSRAFGDKANRDRLNADLTTQAAKPARGLALITGETVPDIGSSGQARMYMINLDRKSYTYSAEMDQLRKDAEDGVLRLAMAKYIEWLLPQADQLPEILRQLFTEYRNMAHDLIAGAATNDRADDAAAHIMIGLTMMLRWMESLGVTNEESAAEQLREWWGVVLSNIREQGSEGRDESPVSLFMAATREMLISQVATVVDLTPGSDQKRPTKGNVGFMDTVNYYFLPDQLYGAVVKFYNDQNRLFPLSKSALFKIMREDRIIEQWDTQANKSTKNKRIDGKTARYLWIPRWRIDSGVQPEPDNVQVQLAEVDDPDNPFNE